MSEETTRPPRRARPRKPIKGAVPHAGGRPTLLNEDLIKKIVSFLSVGTYIETASAACGVPKQQLYAWMKDAAYLMRLRHEAHERDEPFPLNDKERMLLKFSDAVEQAMAQAEIRDLTTITLAARAGQWQASAWRLERRFPKKYGRQYVIEAEKPEPQTDGMKHIDVSKLPDDKLKQLENFLSEIVNEPNETEKEQP